MNANGAVSHDAAPHRAWIVWFTGLAAVVLVSGATGAERLTGGETIPATGGQIVVHPINHATLALGWNSLTIYVDPVGEAARFATMPKPGVILITHEHGDHLSLDTLRAVSVEATRLVAPPAVVGRLPAGLRERAITLAAGHATNVSGVRVEAVPAYNLTPERTKFHPKGRGVGYVVTVGGKRVYISGDTEDIPEMRSLQNIEIAFVCMNLPYTMTVEQAADAVHAFRPKIVYPYHCRGSDLGRFSQLVGEGTGIEVRIRDWYR